jgi:hypothetical protein
MTNRKLDVPRSAVALLTAIAARDVEAMNAIYRDAEPWLWQQSGRAFTSLMASFLGRLFLDEVHRHEGCDGVPRRLVNLGQRFAGDDHCPCCGTFVDTHGGTEPGSR